MQTFWQRLQNLLCFWSFHLLHDYPSWAANVKQLHSDYGFDPMAPEERRRIALTLTPLDFAVEWLRPVTPDFKMVGPVLARPGKPLPADLEASPSLLLCTRIWASPT
jgi:hypothetical protein